MKTHAPNNEGDFLKMPEIKGEIIMQAFDGEIVLWRELNRNYVVRYGLSESTGHPSLNGPCGALINYTACIEHYINSEHIS